MMSHEDKIALIMKRRHLPPPKLGVMRKNTPQEPSRPVTQPRRESVQHQFGYMRRRRSAVGNVRGRYDVAHFEKRRGTARSVGGRGGAEMREEESVARLAFFGEDDQMGKVSTGSEGAYFFHGIGFTRIVIHFGYESHEIGDEGE